MFTAEMVGFFKKLDNAKWLGWVALSLVPALSFVLMLTGFVGTGLQVLAVYVSCFIGAIAGSMLGRSAMRLFGKNNPNLKVRLCSGLACFGFLALSNLVLSLSNDYLDNGFYVASLGQVFFGASIGGVLFFLLSSPEGIE